MLLEANKDEAHVGAGPSENIGPGGSSETVAVAETDNDDGQAASTDESGDEGYDPVEDEITKKRRFQNVKFEELSVYGIPSSPHALR